MKNQMKTLELARIYESQGYFQDAFDIYCALKDKSPNSEISAGVNRMQKRIDFADSNFSKSDDAEKQDLHSLVSSLMSDSDMDLNDDTQTVKESHAGLLLEQWFSLLFIQDQYNQIQKIKRKLPNP